MRGWRGGATVLLQASWLLCYCHNDGSGGYTPPSEKKTASSSEKTIPYVNHERGCDLAAGAAHSEAHMVMKSSR